MSNRSEFEEWAMAGSKLLEETDSYVKIQLFNDRVVYASPTDESVTPCLAGEGAEGWENWISSWFHRNLRPDHLFIDIGANCGYYSVLASLVTTSVWAFEPNPAYIPLLRSTAEDNDWAMDMQVFPFALSDSLGEAILYTPGNLEGSSSIRGGQPGYATKEVAVETRVLDEFTPYYENQPVLIKIDAEGAEEMIWEGGKMFRTMHRPTFVMEYTPGSYSDGFVESLEEYGALSIINFDGDEEPVAREFLESTSEWKTLVVRP